jgi:hypothetical protein
MRYADGEVPPIYNGEVIASNPAEANRGRRVRDALILASFAVAVLCGLWLLRDATTFALQPADPSIGRARGCYTSLDLVLGGGPSENGLFSGTRLAELLVGVPMLLLASLLFVRRLLRSDFELPLVSLAGAWGMWLAGGSFFWRFHDTDMYLTWRIIGDTPNVLAAKVAAIAIVALNVFAVAIAWYFIGRSGRSLRFANLREPLWLYGGWSSSRALFNDVSALSLIALPLLFVPVIGFVVGRRLRIT